MHSFKHPMEEKEKWKLLSIGLAFFLASSMIIISELNSRPDYISEYDLIANEFEALDLESPQWNETTRLFEVWNGSTVFVGYTKFNDMETNTLEVVRFDDSKIVFLGGKNEYVTIGDNRTVIARREVQRRFEI